MDRSLIPRPRHLRHRRGEWYAVQNNQPKKQNVAEVAGLSGAQDEAQPEETGRGPRRSGIALCLSGGGFRAALFHLGATRRLHELGILPRVRTISSVSGGSIYAAFLADRLVNHNKGSGLTFQDWESEVAAPFRAFATRDLRTLLVLAHLLWNWALPGLRARHLERRYRKRLTALRLRDLPKKPRFVFCATDLTFGVNWIFTREKAGDYQAGYVTSTSDWPLARAVAASSCFPPIFGPLRVRIPHAEFKRRNYRGKDYARLVSGLRLSDGGVYDNMGYEPVLRDHEYVLVSDCGAPFEFSASSRPVSRLLRYTGVIMNQAGALRKRLLFSAFTDKKFSGAYWGIGDSIRSDPDGEFRGYAPGLVEEVISRVRTDLDTFTDAEMRVLENHGYFVADKALRRRLPEWFPAGAPPPRAPHPEWADESAVRRGLKGSASRISVRRLFFG